MRWPPRVDGSSYGGYFRRMNVGTKELKNRLSHFLRLVRAGERVVVCDRGEPIAELRRIAASMRPDERAALEDLGKQGLVTLGHGRLPDFEPAVRRGKRRVSAIVIEDRD